jgi:hypothetical protein
MARLQHIGSSEDWFIGEDKTLLFEIYASAGVIQDVAAFAMSFRLRVMGGSDRVVLTKTTASGITFTGSFNADPDTNTQRTNVEIADTDTDNLPSGKYQYWLWRTDAGNETVLAYGDVELKRAS